MPHIRLLGLVLFITTVFLAMAAAATQTTHIRFRRLNLPSESPPSETSGVAGRTADAVLPPSGLSEPARKFDQGTELASSNVHDNQFVAVPVIYPLLLAGGAGLALWFVPAARAPSSKKPRRRQRRR